MFANRYTALGLLCMALGACTPQMDAYEIGQMRLVRNSNSSRRARLGLRDVVDCQHHRSESGEVHRVTRIAADD